MEKSKTIVLIHGNFVTNRSWDLWKEYYESKGYAVHAPANPGHDGEPAELRANEHPELATMKFKDVVDNVANLIDSLPEKPFVIGHSMAGLAVMKLVEMDKAVAGVSIHGAPPKNVFPAPVQTFKTVLGSLGLLSSKTAWMGTREWFDYAFFNTLPEDQRATAFDDHAVPESTRLSKSLLFDGFAAVDFKKPHVPLLFLGGTSDNIFPDSFTKRIAGKYKHADSKVDVKIYEGRSHFTCGEPGWQAVADDILEWYEAL